MRRRLVILSRLECDVMTELKEEEWLVRREKKRGMKEVEEKRREVGEQSRKERQERGSRDEERREVREKREERRKGSW